ncbi:pilus assembly protein PilM [Anaeromyxobacter sp. Fw109-5]|uniref:type II secretion system protein GspL n=1 Tax=Anaeromyxobacter sp. (strain Fw109-5) TaxID=404589 RepID=UPI0000ED7891|nr:pilus assembly protein PilM [Anaeromyxobacter sp. Fw109-5]ABS24935.1 Fimbrial assembly family protein [Anaeromyxobacter sp. Fw109-5]
MAQRILGLDLGAHAVKGVLLESTYRGYTVVDSARAPVAPPADDGARLVSRQADALRALLAERGWRPEAVIAAFPGAAASSHVVTLPFTEPRRIEQTVGFEVEGQIPFDLDEVAWDWQPLHAHDGETDLHVSVVRKEELAALVAALAAAGVDPRAVVPAGPAYAALFATGAVAAPEADAPPDGADVVLDVGHERTNLCVVANGGAEAVRTFAFGAAHLARSVARELGLPEGDAPAALAAGEADPRAGEAQRRALAPLARELRATLRAWHARAGARPVRRLLLCGEAARLPGLTELLAPEVEGPVAPLALAAPAAERIPAEEAPGLALALALALRGHQGARAPRLNLRRGELAFTRDFEHVKGKVTRLGVFAALLVLLAVVSSGVRLFALARQEKALDDALCDAEQKVLGKCYASFEEAQAVLRGRGTPGAAIPRVSAVEVFAELAQRAPDVPLRFERMEVTKDKLHLQGTTDAAENVDKIVSALQASRCFGDARSGGARRRASDGKFEFSIDSGITCLESGPAAPGGRG